LQQHPGRVPPEHADFASTPASAAEANHIIVFYPEGRQPSAGMLLLWSTQGWIGQMMRL